MPQISDALSTCTDTYAKKFSAAMPQCDAGMCMVAYGHAHVHIAAPSGTLVKSAEARFRVVHSAALHSAIVSASAGPPAAPAPAISACCMLRGALIF